MGHKVQQSTILSNFPLATWYRYKKFFQLFPFQEKNELYQHDHPLILEICYSPDVWPDRTELLWYRDEYERERFEHIEKHSNKPMDNQNDTWVQAYQKQNKFFRLSAISMELLHLLTLFTNYRFFTYDTRQSWFVPIPTPTAKKPATSIWGQPGFTSDNQRSLKAFSSPDCDEAIKVPSNTYYTRCRDAYYAGKENIIKFPENIDALFDFYFGLDYVKKRAFYIACHLYNQALKFNRNAPSLSLIAAIMGIEALIHYDSNDVNKCDECGADKSIERCSKCGLPCYRVTSKFKEFICTFGSSQFKKFSRRLYEMRSKLAHGGLLRDDLFDTGFYAGKKDEEQMFRRNSLILARITMINWLINTREEN